MSKKVDSMIAEYVYAITAETYAVKFGRSVRPRDRLSSLQTSCPLRLKVLGVVPGGCGLEGRIHGFLRQHRIRGEWFRINRATLPFIEAFSDESRQAVESLLDRSDPRTTERQIASPYRGLSSYLGKRIYAKS